MLNEFSGEITLVEGYRDSVRLCRHLCHRVADATIVAVTILGCDDKQSILDVEKRITHRLISIKS